MKTDRAEKHQKNINQKIRNPQGKKLKGRYSPLTQTHTKPPPPL